jgi:hypothetical protein
MKTLVLLGGVLLLGLAPTGDLLTEKIAVLNDLADAIEAKKPKADLEKLQGKLDAVEKKLDGLKDEERQKLEADHKEGLARATARLRLARAEALLRDHLALADELEKLQARARDVEKKLEGLQLTEEEVKKLEGKEGLARVAGRFASFGADRLMKDTIALLNQMADAIEKKDEAKVKELQKKIEANGKKLEDLKLSADEKKKLEEKYKEDFAKAVAKVLEAGLKAGIPPDPKKDKKDGPGDK